MLSGYWQQLRKVNKTWEKLAMRFAQCHGREVALLQTAAEGLRVSWYRRTGSPWLPCLHKTQSRMY